MFNSIKNINSSAFEAIKKAHTAKESIKDDVVSAEQKSKIDSILNQLNDSLTKFNSYRSTRIHRIICFLTGNRHLGTKIQAAINELKGFGVTTSPAEKAEEPNRLKTYQEALALDRKINSLGKVVHRMKDQFLPQAIIRHEKLLAESNQSKEKYKKILKKKEGVLQGLMTPQSKVDAAKKEMDEKEAAEVKVFEGLTQLKKALLREEEKLNEYVSQFHALVKQNPEIMKQGPDKLKQMIEDLKK